MLKFYFYSGDKDHKYHESKDFYEMHQMHLQQQNSHPHLRNLSHSPQRLLSVGSPSSIDGHSMQHQPISPQLLTIHQQQQHLSSSGSSQQSTIPIMQQQHHNKSMQKVQQHSPQHQQQPQQQQAPPPLHMVMSTGHPMSQSNGSSHYGSHNSHHQQQNGETRPSVIESNQPMIIGCT